MEDSTSDSEFQMPLSAADDPKFHECLEHRHRAGKLSDRAMTLAREITEHGETPDRLQKMATIGNQIKQLGPEPHPGYLFVNWTTSSRE